MNKEQSLSAKNLQSSFSKWKKTDTQKKEYNMKSSLQNSASYTVGKNAVRGKL